jgi:hypothetical protein
MSKAIKWKPAVLASMVFVVTAAAIAQALAAEGDSGTQASTGRLSILNDPAYQGYLRWNGFHVGSAADPSGTMLGPEGRAAMQTKADGLNILDDPAYQAYVRWNGLLAECPVCGRR